MINLQCVWIWLVAIKEGITAGDLESTGLVELGAKPLLADWLLKAKEDCKLWQHHSLLLRLYLSVVQVRVCKMMGRLCGQLRMHL